MRIVVLGATGLIGRLISDELESRDHEVVRASRATGVDALTGSGLDEAFRKADSVVDALNTTTRNRRAAVSLFSTTARNITEAARRAEVAHLVPVSIWNAAHPQASGYGYYAGKAAQEQIVMASEVPATIVRSTQWYELAETLLHAARVGRVAVVPHMLSRPVAAATAARRVAELADGPVIRDGVVVAGPERRDLYDLARAIATARGDRVRLLGMNPGALRAFSSGVLLPDDDVPGIGPTFDEWLAAR